MDAATVSASVHPVHKLKRAQVFEIVVVSQASWVPESTRPVR